MRLAFRIVLGTALVLGLSAGNARADTTASQLVDLSRAGLSDDILVELIESDGSTFQLTAADVLALHREGLSDKVIVAMARTAKKAKPVEAPAAAPAPASAPAPAPPTVVNVHQTVTQHVEAPLRQSKPSYAVPIAVPVYLPVTPVAKPQPVYWGWGGQRRPDSWDDGAKADPNDAKDKKDH